MGKEVVGADGGAGVGLGSRITAVPTGGVWVDPTEGTTTDEDADPPELEG